MLQRLIILGQPALIFITLHKRIFIAMVLPFSKLRNVKLLWLVLLCMLFTSCQRDKPIFSYTVVVTKDNPVCFTSSGPGMYVLANKGRMPVKFWFSGVNGVNYRNAVTMVKSVTDSTMTDRTKAFNLWRMVSQSGFHYPFDYNHQLPDHTMPIALNTFPYFLCGEKAGILAGLLEQAGLKARIIKLKNHIAVETFYDQTWHLLDADESVAFKKPNGEVASCADLASNLEWIDEKNVIKSAQAKFVGYNDYRSYFQSYHIINTQKETAESYVPTTMDLQLYPGDEIRFQLEPPAAIIQLLFPRFAYRTHGVLIRSLRPNGLNVEPLGAGAWCITEQLPYYVKSVKVSGLKGANTRIKLKTTNRLTKTDTVYVITKSGEESTSVINFDSPSSAHIYYQYQLEIDGCNAADLAKATLSTSFEFNHLTLPFAKRQSVVVSFFQGDSLTFTHARK